MDIRFDAGRNGPFCGFFFFIIDGESLHIILPSFIEIGQELFEIMDIKTQTHTFVS